MHGYYDTLACVCRPKSTRKKHTHLQRIQFYLMPAPVRRKKLHPLTIRPCHPRSLVQLTFSLSMCVCMHAIYARERARPTSALSLPNILCEVGERRRRHARVCMFVGVCLRFVCVCVCVTVHAYRVFDGAVKRGACSCRQCVCAQVGDGVRG